MIKSIITILAFFVLLPLQSREKVLLIDGKNPHHNWQQTSASLKEILQTEFDVIQITKDEAEWQTSEVDFSQFKAVILNYWGKWPPGLFNKLETFVANGGGLVTVHSALASFPENQKFAEMVGLKWQGISKGKRIFLDGDLKQVETPAGEGVKCGHSKQHEFKLSAVKESLFEKEINLNPSHNKDEMYHALRGPAKNLKIQGFSKSPMTEKNEPLIWTVEYGKGRSFITALGHSAEAMGSKVFKSTLLNGTIWAAAVQKQKVNLKNLKQVEPSDKTISEHIDFSVPVFGKYALVKLPIKTGVDMWNPTALARDESGRIWGANYTGEIFSLHDTDGDGLEDHAELFCNVKDDKQRYPTCLAWHKGELYVGTTQEIRAYKDSDGDFKADSSRVYFNDFPWTLHYFDWTFALEFGPDDHAYVIFCTDYLNKDRADDPKKFRGAIVRISPDGKNSEIFASGARFAYGMAFNQHGDLFFSDNKGGGNPTEEINFAEKGKFYGHNGGEKGKYPGLETVNPLVEVKYGFGSGGLEFNEVSNDFDGTGGNLFLVCWGPDGKWDRGSLVRIELTKKDDGSYDAKEHLVAGEFAKIIDAKFGLNGDLYIAQFGKEGRRHIPYDKPEGAIYRMIHKSWIEPQQYTKLISAPVINGDLLNGKKTFENRCAICHDVDSMSRKKLGPPLLGVGNMFGKKDFLEAVNNPSNGIKTDYETHEIVKKDGTKLTGRVSSIDEEGIHLMMVGNTVLKLKKEEVASQKMLDTSLMPPGLLNGLNRNEINDLLAYMKIRKVNVAVQAVASSPDGLKKDGDSTGDQAAIDGNDKTYWDEEDGKEKYILQLDFPKEQSISEMVIKGFSQHKFSPKSFKVLADGKEIFEVKEAIYKNNKFTFSFATTTCKKIELVITSSYGLSPGIRELEVYE